MGTLSTTRLSLRRFTLEDAPFVLALVNEPPFLRFIGDKGVRSLEDARGYLTDGPLASYARHGFGLYLAALRESGAPIGMCGLLKRETLDDVDIGFAFLEAHWGRGYAFEAAAAVLAHGREDLGIERIVAVTAPDNDRSAALLGKLGLRFDRDVDLDGDGRASRLFAPG